MFRRKISHLFHDGITVSAVATGLDVSDFRNVVLRINSSGSFAGTIKLQGFVNVEAVTTLPNFADGENTNDGTAANPWMYIQVVDLEDGTTKDGDLGVVYSGTDSVRLVEANINALDIIGIHVTNVTAGTVTIVAHAYTNA